MAIYVFFINRLRQEQHNKLILKTDKLKRNFIFLGKKILQCEEIVFWLFFLSL